MIEGGSNYSSDLEFRTAFPRVHWTAVDGAAQIHEDLSEDTVAELKESWRQRSLYFVENGINLGHKIGEGGQADIFEALFGYQPCGLIDKVFKHDSLASLLDRCPPQIFQFEGDCKYIIRVFAGVLLNCIED